MFDIQQRGSNVRREVIGGITTFMAMSYIIFVQAGVLGGAAGMNTGGVIAATCLAGGVASIFMGLLANYPIALAPGMGENFFFAFTLVVAAGRWGVAPEAGWKVALAMVVIAGAVFLLLSLVQLRSKVLSSIPDALKSGIAAGIGLLIARVGFDWSRLVDPVTGALSPGLGGFADNPAAVVTLVGLGVTVVLIVFRVRGSVLLGILAATAAAGLFGRTQWQTPVALPGGLGATAGGFVEGFSLLVGAIGQHWAEMLTLLFVLLFMDLFDTVGTLVGVAGRAGLMRDGELPRAERALLADATGTVLGGALGTSTVTSYVESVTGVQSGARTGLAAIVAGVCLIAAMFFQPLVGVVIGEFTNPAGDPIYPTLAAALIVVGAMMLRTVREIDWDSPTEYIPAFLTLIVMPLTLSISAGIAAGFISYAVLKFLSLRWKECPLLVYVFAALFVVQYVLAAWV